MIYRLMPTTLIPLAGLALAAAVPMQAQLAAKSPFTSATGAEATSPAANAPLEFRGYMETSEGVQYRLYDPAKKTGIWVKVNEKNPDLEVTVKQHDTDKETLTVEHQGKSLTLSQRKSKVISSGSVAMPPAMAAAAATPNVLPAVTQAVVLNPTPADEQRRLDAVAAEVARRRALRQQAEQQTPPGGAPQPAMAPGVQPAGNFQAAPQPLVQPQGVPGEVRGRGPNQAAPR